MTQGTDGCDPVPSREGRARRSLTGKVDVEEVGRILQGNSDILLYSIWDCSGVCSKRGFLHTDLHPSFSQLTGKRREGQFHIVNGGKTLAIGVLVPEGENKSGNLEISSNNSVKTPSMFPSSEKSQLGEY